MRCQLTGFYCDDCDSTFTFNHLIIIKPEKLILSHRLGLRHGLLSDTSNCGLRMRRECRERLPRNVRDARAVMHAGIANQRHPLKSEAEETFPAFPAHAQRAILRIWQEASWNNGMGCMFCFALITQNEMDQSCIKTPFHIKSLTCFLIGLWILGWHSMREKYVKIRLLTSFPTEVTWYDII